MFLVKQGLEDNFDAKYANDSKKDMEDAVAQSSVLLRDAEVQAQFSDYYYDYVSPTKSPLVPITDDKKVTVKKDGDQISPSEVNIAA